MKKLHSLKPLKPTLVEGNYVGYWYDEVYRRSIYLIWPQKGATIQTAGLIKTLKSWWKIDLDPDDEFGGKTLELPQGAVIVLSEWEDRPFDYGLLAHEAVHVAEYNLFDLGLKHTEESSEAFAYYIEHVVRLGSELTHKTHK